MRIILLGAPGSGKGTQARFIMNRYNIPQISTGDMLRTMVKSSCNIGKKIKDIVNSGKLVTDELVISLIRKRINQKDCQNGFLLDGFPRTITQANSIKKANINIDYIIEICVPNELLIERMIGRRIHVSSGRIYHVKFNPPKIKNKDDITSETLTVRKDDQKEIVHQRLIEYYQATSPLISFYKKEAQIGNIRYIKIDGTQSPTDIHEELKKFVS